MAAKQFLNPTGKLLLCLFMTTVMGYYFITSIMQGETFQLLNIVRGIVFAAFVYLTIKSGIDILFRKTD